MIQRDRVEARERTNEGETLNKREREERERIVREGRESRIGKCFKDIVEKPWIYIDGQRRERERGDNEHST